jgi:uncharacterized membrane protein
MKTKALNLWYSVRSSYWFIPTLMAFLAILLAPFLVAIDMSLEPAWTQSLVEVFLNEPQGVRLLLATIAGSMITVAGVAFSVTIVTLTLASAQFGPRLLANFMRDIGNQVVLGTFIATFLYCLLVLLSVESDASNGEAPCISVIVAVVLALASVIVLIFFIHHAAEIIQVKSVIAKVSHDLYHMIDRVFPKELGDQPPLNMQNDTLENLAADSCPIAATRSGYLQAIARDNLVKIAAGHGLVLFSQYQPGRFVVQGSPLVLVWPREKVDRCLAEKIRNWFILGDQRTYEQDLEFAIDLLVEIAVRALSPGTNDPFTAMMCVDRLGAALCQIATRDFPLTTFVDSNGKIRLVEKPITFGDLTDSVFNQIRQYGHPSVAVNIRLLEVLGLIAQRAARADDKSVLLRHAGMIRRSCEENFTVELDRKHAEERYRAFLEDLRQGPEELNSVGYLRDEK